QSTDLINYVKSLLKYYDDNQTLPDPNEKGDSEKPAALNIKEKNFKKSPYADTFQLYSTIIMKLQKNMGKKLDIAKKVDELLGDDKSLINLNKEIAWIKSQLQGNPTQADLKEAWNEKFDNTVKIPEGNLKKIYEGMLTELEQRAKVATENSSYYKLKRALLNIFGGKENATQAVRTAVWNTPGAVGEVGNALQVYTKDSLASVGIDWDKLSPEAKKAIATVLAAGAALIIKIQANNSLTADEKKKYLDDGLGAMMRDVTNIAIADQFGVSVDVVASGDAEAIATEAAMNKIIKSLTPEDTTGYNYDYSAVNSKNYTSNLDKFTSENDHILNPTSSTKSSSTTKSSPGKSYPSLADLEADNF
ncbi:MAG: hypothetical protein JO129_02120, partial [Candidatus Dependentiae bacterium]|nr:hypothetical protein [Candidatus Dependentiae bacterium]